MTNLFERRKEKIAKKESEREGEREKKRQPNSIYFSVNSFYGGGVLRISLNDTSHIL